MTVIRRSRRFGLLVTAASLAGAAAFAAAPPAGERIGNQATATYKNASGDTVRVTSNKVETIVQQIAALTLATPTNKDGVRGAKVFIPHTITNTGNGPDSYSVTALSPIAGTFALGTDIRIFADADLDGVADSTTPLAADTSGTAITPLLNAGERYGIIIEANVPSTATPNQTDTITVTATSAFDGTVTQTNDDVITVTGDAITDILKEMTVVDTVADNLTGPGDTVTIRLSYSSTGLADANRLIVSDILDPRLVFVPGSARWSDDPDALDGTAGDATDIAITAFEQTNGSGHGIEFTYDIPSNTVVFQIDTVPQGKTGFVTFDATIDTVNAVPAGDIANTATQTTGTTKDPAPNSNTATVTVDEIHRITAADSSSTTYAPDPDNSTNLNTTVVSASDDGTASDDIVEVTDIVTQGATIPMQVVLTNHSNSTQNVDVSFANDAANGFPVGTSFQLVGPDGITPVAGPVGPVAVGDTTTVTLIATLPAATTTVPAGGFNATVSAVASDGGVPNTVTTRFAGTISAAEVDLSNENGTPTVSTDNAGFGTAPANQSNGGLPFVTEATDPGESVSFPLDIANNGPTSDNYDLAITGLPAGYTVVFTLDGTPITNTGNIPSGESVDVIATITPPAGAPPATTNFVTSVTSGSTGQGDTVLNAVTVNSVVDVRITSDQNRQAAPSGILDIPHTIFNDGNSPIIAGALTLPTTGGFTTFSGTLFHDVNGDGVADTNDVVIDNIDDIIVGGVTGIPALGSRDVILRVQVPSTATVGLVESQTITVADTLTAASGAVTDSDTSNNSVTDTVTIVSGDVSLNKVQRLTDCVSGSAAMVGSPAAPSVFTPGTVNATPGQCITYSITALNSGTANADDVVITDATPTWTKMTNCGGNCAASVTPGTLAGFANDSTGTLTGTIGQLIPGAQGVMTFTVKIDD